MSSGRDRTPLAGQPEQRPLQGAGTARSTDARLTRLHLRVGLQALARAELETMAGEGTLDLPAIADLAEVRWRSGDLVGAAEAAEAHLGSGGDELVCHVIAAEGMAAQGRTGDARRIAALVLDRVGDGLDALFAGQPRSAVWPSETIVEEEVPEVLAEKGAASGGFPVGVRGVGRPSRAREAGSRGLPPLPAEDTAPAPVTPFPAVHGRPLAEEIEAAEAELAAGELAALAGRLALLLRSDAVLAPAILSLAERALERAPAGSLEVATLHLVVGDAYRLLGHEREAAAAFERTREQIVERERPAGGASADPDEAPAGPQEDAHQDAQEDAQKETL
ncbi:MAG TPA: hypothetical protein VFK38_04725 [Candidatus Limnocylindrales bacterium]|nr:hypothetical protein [Candidatus Limnocylindrales bacterium]